VFSAFGGIAGAFAAIRLIRAISHNLFWTTPIVVAFLAFGFFSALCVLIAGDLIVRPKSPAGFPHPAK